MMHSATTVHHTRTVSLALAMLLAFACATATAQVGYTFSMEQGTWTPLVGATKMPNTFGDSVDVVELPNEPFRMFNRTFTFTGDSAMQVAGSGFLRWFIDDTNVVVFDGLFAQLAPRDTASASISYLLDGPPGNRILKVQWINGRALAGAATDSVHFQIWLYQQSGVIEFRFGPSKVDDMASFGNGPWVGAFYSPLSFSRMNEKLWITGDPAAPRFDTVRSFVFRKINAVPANGTIYRLTPRLVASTPEESESEASMMLYPNPVHTTLTMHLAAGATARYAVMDLTGRQVLSGTTQGARTDIDVSPLAAGHYVLNLTSEGSQTLSRRFVKE